MEQRIINNHEINDIIIFFSTISVKGCVTASKVSWHSKVYKAVTFFSYLKITNMEDNDVIFIYSSVSLLSNRS